MYVTCKCLNVWIKTQGSEFKNLNEDDVELSKLERADLFFKENLAMAPKLEGINKEQVGLIESRNVGSWVVNKCNNCSIFTHAVHKEHGAALVLINTNMITSLDEIEKLKASPNYSTIYRIIIDHSGDDGEYIQAPTKYSVSQLSSNLQLALTSIQQQLEQAVQRKSISIEEKIREFTAEQYQHLEEFRDQAHTEHRLLARLICNKELENKSTSTVDSAAKNSPIKATKEIFPASPDKKTIGFSTRQVHETSDAQGFIGGNNIRQQAATKHPANILINGGKDRNDRRLKTFEKRTDSFDAEALFPFEGIDDTLTGDGHPSDDESDTDGRDEGIHIPRGQRGGHPTLAKSLPVTVPKFSFVNRTMQDQDDDQLSGDPLDPHNIRASIKALAKSVHGDTVFGDLPRPRFSTQI